MFGLSEMEMVVGGGMLLLAWVLLSRGGISTTKLMALAGGVFFAIALGLRESVNWIG